MFTTIPHNAPISPCFLAFSQFNGDRIRGKRRAPTAAKARNSQSVSPLFSSVHDAKRRTRTRSRSQFVFLSLPTDLALHNSNTSIHVLPARHISLSLDANTKRETGHQAQINNIKAAKVVPAFFALYLPHSFSPSHHLQAVADIVRTCLGPKSMLKMILSQSGQIVMTNDGNAILREVNVQHPAAKYPRFLLFRFLH